jgi:hypothetical protein
MLIGNLPLVPESRVRTQDNPCGVCDGETIRGAGYSFQQFGLPFSITITPILHTQWQDFPLNKRANKTGIFCLVGGTCVLSPFMLGPVRQARKYRVAQK